MTLGKEIDLLKNYPQSKRDVSGRLASKTEEDKCIAQKFGKEFFDGSRNHGYGGFSYNPRFWQPVVPRFQKHWNLKSNDSVLDVGCAKGFMLYDLKESIPDLKVNGVDISKYAIANTKKEISRFCQVANAISLPYDDSSIDVVISVNTLHNLNESDIKMALLEVERVKKRGSFITLDAYRNDEEKERMEAWNLTAKTVMHVNQWKEFFNDIGYTGDYYWFIP